MSANEDSANLFLHETDMLKQTIDEWSQKIGDIPMEQIVEIYYKVINVNSLSKISENPDDLSELQNKIKNAKNTIDETFNKSFHPLLMSKIQNSIETIKNELKEIQNTNNQKTKEKIEEQAKMYEDLRKLMSTKEFVEQYNKLIDNSGN
jgi:glutamyl-tRNA reductase